MAKFRVGITVEVEAESATSALAFAVGQTPIWRPIERTSVTYIPQQGDIVTVSAPPPHETSTHNDQGIRYDISYRIIKASRQTAHLREVGSGKRVIVWNRDIQPVVSDKRVACDYRIRTAGGALARMAPDFIRKTAKK
jgi:hypothetical protein